MAHEGLRRGGLVRTTLKLTRICTVPPPLISTWRTPYAEPLAMSTAALLEHDPSHCSPRFFHATGQTLTDHPSSMVSLCGRDNFDVVIRMSEAFMSKRFLVTGGAGFIGSAVVRRLVEKSEHKVLVLDKLTYAGNLESLATVAGNSRYRFEQVDIVDTAALRRVFDEYSPDVVMHLAAESHVDRSIDGPAQFIQTNIVGTFSLLEIALSHWRALPSSRKATSAFIMSLPMKCLARSALPDIFARNQPTAPTRPTRRQRLHRIILYALGIIPTGCRC